MLGRIWTECDLLVAECLRTGVWDGLSAGGDWPPRCRSSCYESRRETEERASVPVRPVSDAIDDTLALSPELSVDEAAAGLELTREPDLGLRLADLPVGPRRTAVQGAGQRAHRRRRHAGR